MYHKIRGVRQINTKEYITRGQTLSVLYRYQQQSQQKKLAMSKSGTTEHILVFPYPAQGHMLPLLDLTHQLALRNLTITILVTPKNLPLLTPLLNLHPSIQPLVLPFPNNSSVPPGVENGKDLPIFYFRTMIRVMGELYSPLLDWFQSHISPPSAILSDFLLGWTHHLASELGIPRIVFSPSGVFAFQVLHSLFHDLPKDNPVHQISFPSIPTSPIFPWWQLSPLYQTYKSGDPDSEFLRAGFLANLASWGIVFNSFDKMESIYLQELKKNSTNVWAVGPLLPTTRSRSTSADDVVLVSWLDTCPDNSVVYLCFGSQTVLHNKQMEQLALGLEQSGIRFIWSVKEPTVGYDSMEYGKVPNGFEQRMAGRGVVIKGWASQVMILKHRAVGAFITHCGWNSVLEAIVAGVPLLTWAMSADQYSNATLLVDQLGVATRVCEGVDTVPNAEDLSGVLVKSMDKEREQITALQKAAFDAIKEGGSSSKDLDDLVRTLSELQT